MQMGFNDAMYRARPASVDELRVDPTPILLRRSSGEPTLTGTGRPLFVDCHGNRLIKLLYRVVRDLGGNLDGI